MNRDLALLPLSVQDWFVKPADTLVRGESYIVHKANQCSAWRHGWYCTRGKGHALPHVAGDGYNAIAVWDQSWYADTRWEYAVPTHAVPARQSLSQVAYERALPPSSP